jgi:putative membrane protein insertion efficiency factor
MKTVLLALIRTYQLTLSAFMGRRCRYLPTCSEYASDAIHKHGAWHGGLLAIARISRCHPWGGAGFDPVPDVYEGPVWKQKRPD